MRFCWDLRRSCRQQFSLTAACSLPSCYSLSERSISGPKGRRIPKLVAGETRPLTIDEELNHLDSLLRRLKIEYEVYFNNPSKRPPSDMEWKVLALLRKNSDGVR